MNTDILKNAGSLVGKTSYFLQKHSPEICQGAGMIGMVVTVVLACKATLKLPEKTETFKKRLDRAKSRASNSSDNGHEIAKVYGMYAWDIAKLYGPSAMLGVASLGSMCAATQILRNRNASLTAAYAALDTGFKRYRERVVDRFGETVDKQLMHGSTEETIKEKEVGEDGKERTVKKKVNAIDSKAFKSCSPYAVIFDDTNPRFNKDAELNKFFITQTERYFNKLLRAKRIVFLNDVYEALGFPKTKAGQVVGWVYDPSDPNHEGDNYIDFGLKDIYYDKTRDFMNGYEPAVLLDFNVDGNVWDKLPTK